MKDDTPESLFFDVATILEEHTKTLQNVRQAFEQLFKDVAEIKRRLDKLESADNSLNSSEAKFVANVTARLKAISTTLDKKV